MYFDPGRRTATAARAVAVRGDRRRRPRVRKSRQSRRGAYAPRWLITSSRRKPSAFVPVVASWVRMGAGSAPRPGSLVVVSRPAGGLGRRSPLNWEAERLAAAGCLDGVTARQRSRTALPVGADAAAALAIPRQGSSIRQVHHARVFPGRRPRRRRRRDRGPRRRTPGPAGRRAVLPRVVGLSRGGAPPLDLTSRRPSPCRRPRRRHGPRAAARGRRDRVPPRRRARAREELAPARPRAHGEGLRRQRHRSGAADEALPAAAPARRQVGVRTLSARVGSIGDNDLGGWYSYRASRRPSTSWCAQRRSSSGASARRRSAWPSIPGRSTPACRRRSRRQASRSARGPGRRDACCASSTG